MEHFKVQKISNPVKNVIWQYAILKNVKPHLFLKLHDKNDRAKGMKEIKENSKLVKKKNLRQM